MLFDKDHLEKNGFTYTEHFNFSFKYGWMLFLAALASFIHGIFPGLFKYTSARITFKIVDAVKKYNIGKNDNNTLGI